MFPVPTRRYEQFSQMQPPCIAVETMTEVGVDVKVGDYLLAINGQDLEATDNPEEFLRRRVEQLLDRPDAEFLQAAAYVLAKNADLYRRLA